MRGRFHFGNRNRRALSALAILAEGWAAHANVRLTAVPPALPGVYCFCRTPVRRLSLEATMRKLLALVLLAFVGVGMVAASASACPHDARYEGS